MTTIELIDSYKELLPTYEKFAETVRDILTSELTKKVEVHSIQFRAKSVESFKTKSQQTLDEDESQPKYTDPLSQITDLAGIRVIVFFPKSLSFICASIETVFEVLEKKDVGEERLSQGRFGYQSIHYLVRLPVGLTSQLAMFGRFSGLVAEIQVRTILQHAWAEMEHDIRYKSPEQIPNTIQRRFIALAGMLELADREFQNIQDEDQKLKRAMRSSLRDDLEMAKVSDKEPATGSDSAKYRANENPDQLEFSLRSSQKKAKDLIASGDYKEAIRVYSQRIQFEPEAYTQYLGRAKAKFLSGDRQGALSDINIAAGLNPDDPSIDNLRVQIEEGVLHSPSQLNEAIQSAVKGHAALADGNWGAAFELYSQAQVMGLIYTFSNLNKTMACVLQNDMNAAESFLALISPNRDSPTEINYLALKAIISAYTARNQELSLQNLRGCLDRNNKYDYYQSPIVFLEKGLRIGQPVLSQGVEQVFSALKGTRGSLTSRST